MTRPEAPGHEHTGWRIGSRPLRARLLVAGMAALVIVLDRVTKVAVVDALAHGARRETALPYVELRHVHNRGIAFGLLSGGGVLLIIASIAVALFLLAYLMRIPSHDLLSLAGAGLVAGGAVGNIFDRVQLGYVVDFIHIGFWPTFNIADVGIVTGVVLVLVRLWRPVEPSASEGYGDHAHRG